MKNYKKTIETLQLALTVSFNKKYAINTEQYYNSKYEKWATIYKIEEEYEARNQNGEIIKKKRVVEETYKYLDVLTFFVKKYEEVNGGGEGE